MGFASKLEIGGSQHSLASSLYGTCTTSSGTAAKIVTCPDFDTMIVGTMIAVKFVYSNTAANPTLNVNGLGALPIYTDGTNPPGTTPQDSWAANSVVTFLYDGSAWFMTDMTAFKSIIANALYPVGSIYMSVNDVNPGVLFGGTWEQIQDRFLLAAGSSYAAGAEGGSATKNLQHAHTTQGHTLTTNEIPAHAHKISRVLMHYVGGTSQVYNPTWHSDGGYPWAAINNPSTDNAGGGKSHAHGDTGNGLSTEQDIMPPYLSVYVWKRTA